MTDLDYVPAAGDPFSKARLERLLSKAARQVKKIRGSVAVISLSAARMRKINREWRGINDVTDVISFAWRENRRAVPAIPPPYFGEIYLCSPYIKQQARRFGVPYQEEWMRLFFHGLLHLAGYDHVRKTEASRLFALQEKLIRGGKFVHAKECV